MKKPWFPHNDRKHAFWSRFGTEIYGDIWRSGVDLDGRVWTEVWTWTLTRHGVEIARGESKNHIAAKAAAVNAWGKS